MGKPIKEKICSPDSKTFCTKKLKHNIWVAEEPCELQYWTLRPDHHSNN